MPPSKWLCQALLTAVLFCEVSCSSPENKNSENSILPQQAFETSDSKPESSFEFFRAVISSYAHAQSGISETDTIRLNEFKDLDNLLEQWVDTEYRYKVANLELSRAANEIKEFVRSRNSVI